MLRLAFWALYFLIAMWIYRLGAAEPISALRIIRENCLMCHSGDNPPNGLRLDTVDNMVRGGKSGPALVVFQPDQSLIYKYIVAGKMPPAATLPEDQKAAIRRWIAGGAHQHSMGAQEP